MTNTYLPGQAQVAAMLAYNRLDRVIMLLFCELVAILSSGLTF
jgi:hypothetical protein